MGMFSTSRVAGLSEDFEVQANESYKGAAGAYRAMIEGYQNSYAVFESCIGLDFMEAAVVNESASAEEFEIVQEGFAGDFFTKIKEFLKKLIEKIKGIVNSFIAKVTGTFCRDGKKLVDKYRAEVLKKDLSKMKFKWQKETGKTAILKHDELDKVYGHCIGATGATLDSKITADAYKDDKEKLDDNTYLEADLKSIVGTDCTLAEFSKEFHSYLFEDEETYEGLSDAGINITEVMNILSDGKKAVSEIEKWKTAEEKKVKELIKRADNAQKAAQKLSKDVKTDAQSTNYREINARLAIAMTAANQISTVTTKYFACLLDEKKKELARYKRVFTQAAAYRQKTNEDADLLAEAAGEVAEYEVCELFDNFVID